MSAALVTVGETLALLAAPMPGPLRHAHELRLGVGGAESNVAIGVRRLGGAAAWVGRVGADELGELVLRTLRAEGVDVDHAVVDPDASTSLMLKEQRIAGRARVTYYRHGGPGARLEPLDVDPGLIASAGALHVTGITLALSASARATVHAAVRGARDAGVPISLDVNHRASLWTADEARAAVGELLPLVDHCFIGHREAAALGFHGSPEDVASALCSLGCDTVIVKLGDRGALAAVDGVVHRVDAVPVATVDPVGAGDAFAAGYLAELMAGHGLEQRLDTAAACGAYAVSAHGDWEPLPRRADLRLLTEDGDTVLR